MNSAKLLIEYIGSSGGNVREPIRVFSQSDDCYKCQFVPLGTIEENGNKTVKLQTIYPIAFRVDLSGAEICNFKYHFSELSTYRFSVSHGETMASCSDIEEVENGGNPYLPLLYATIVFLGFAIIWTAGKWVFRKNRAALTQLLSRQPVVDSKKDIGTPATTPPIPSGDQPPANKAKQRLRSLDTFRGLSLVLMIFVNYGGGGYYFFRHALWDGLTVADLLFPWFVWIMGFAVAFSFRGSLKRGDSRFLLFLRVLKRSIILFVLGLVCNTVCNTVELSKLRIMGVLQRLAISYFFCATLEILFGKLAMTTLVNDNSSRFKSVVNFFWDIIGSLPQWLFIIFLVTAHTCITFLLPVEGCPTGYLGTGGLAEGGKYYNCLGGAAKLIDRIILGENHMLVSDPAGNTPLYSSPVVFETEGILGCLTSIVLCYLGQHAGRICTLYQSPTGRISRWLSWAVVWGLAAGVLCNFSTSDGVIPINKNLWSLSFVLALSSMALVLLSLIYVACDVWKIWSGAPFIYPGMNSIAVYMAHMLLNRNFPVKWQVDYQVHWQVLAINLWGVTFFTIMSVIMYHKKVFIAI